LDDLLFFGGGSLLLLSALGAGFITAVIAVLIGWVGLMIMWGLSA